MVFGAGVWLLALFSFSVLSEVRAKAVGRPSTAVAFGHSSEHLRLDDSDSHNWPHWTTAEATPSHRRGRLARSSAPQGLNVIGFRVELAEREPSYDENGVPVLLVGMNATIRLFGSGFNESTHVAVTTIPGIRGETCPYPDSADVNTVLKESIMETSAQVKIRLPEKSEDGVIYYLCVKQDANSPWVHAGNKTESWLQVKAFKKMLPLSLSIVIIIFLLMLSGLFSGLNLGLMALDRTELKIVVNTGTETERQHARKIEPVRSHGNYLLCSLLLGNVLVNSTLTILIDDLTSGLFAVAGSTMAIVIFGEIVPQAICSRHGLAVGARTVYITKLFMIITAPLSYPISLLLDRILGKEIGNVYNRERLKELIKVTNEYNDLEKEEVNIISGTLELKEKMVKDVMTKVDDAFMLSEDAMLDFETLNEIREKGYSRIPVHEKGNRYQVVNILYAKDLAFVDSRLNMPVSVFCKFHPRNIEFVFEDVTLDHMLKLFREGSKGHMAFILKVVTHEERDPFYELVGLVTLEDIIEEMIKAEIVDETDMWSDNRTKRQLDRNTYNMSLFLGKKDTQKYFLSPQLTLAAFQYLCTSVSPFKPEILSLLALRKMLEEDVNRQIKLKRKGYVQNTQSLVIYTKNKPADYFVLILEGLAEVSIGQENLVFVARPFTTFGTEFFMSVCESPLDEVGSKGAPCEFLPDYTVRAHTDITFIKIPMYLYKAALKASKMQEEEGYDLEELGLCLPPDKSGASSPASELQQEYAAATSVSVPTANCSKESKSKASAASSPQSSSPSESKGLLQENTQF